MDPDAVRYHGETFALLTQHGKEAVIAPLLKDALGAHLRLASGFDTDTLGTFTREVPRDGTQLAAARKKARTGMRLVGLPLGLASEGAFVPGLLGLSSVDLEIVILIDDVRGIEIVGRAQGPGLHAQGWARSREELERLSSQAEFPAHALVLRPDDERDPRVRKGLRTWGALRSAFDEVLAESREGRVFVENDSARPPAPAQAGRHRRCD